MREFLQGFERRNRAASFNPRNVATAQPGAALNIALGKTLLLPEES